MGWREYLLPLYAVATLLPRLLPGRAQLTELIFLVALVAFARELPQQLRRFPRLAMALGAYVLVNLLSGARAWAAGGPAASLLEAGARGYLAVLVFIGTAHVARYGVGRLLRWWFRAAVAVAAVAVAAYASEALGGPDPGDLANPIAVYPYFGTVSRLQGTATTFGMFYMLLLPGMFLAWERRRWWALGVLLLAGLLTLGKENLLFPLGLLLLRPGVGPKVAAGALALVLLFVTHFLVLPAGSGVGESFYVSGRVVGRLGQYEIHETTYWLNKRTALTVAGRHPGLGVGPGRYAAYTEQLVSEGRYPAHVGRLDPHSAWTGALAETGYPGLATLLLLSLTLLPRAAAPPSAWRYAGICLLLYLLVSVFKDVMNFRPLWLLLGLWVAGNDGKARV